MTFLLLCVMAVGVQVPDGTVVALRNDRGIVLRVTGSTITHTGMIFNHNGIPWVYDAYPPAVRCMPLNKYEEFVRKQRERSPGEELWLVRPKENYSWDQIRRMLEYAQSQLGRPYGVRAYIANKPKEPIHCSWYTTEILMRSGRFTSKEPWKVTPGDLLDALRSTHRPPEKVNLGETHETPRVPR